MTELFMAVLDMSLTASYVILGVWLMRLSLVVVNVPRRVSYFLWAIVLLRLLVPGFYVSDHSVLPPKLVSGITAEWGDDYMEDTRIIHDTAEGYAAAVEHGNPVITDSSGGQYVITGADGISQPKTVKNTLYPILAGVWVCGMAVMLLWNGLSLLGLKRRLEEAVPIVGNEIYIADSIDTAFVLGFIAPRIYLPSHLTETEQAHILAHEGQHLRRRDHMIKPVAFLVLCVHWFNPLIWMAFLCAMEDMELSCDEAVTRNMDQATKADYAQTLLDLTAGHRRLAVAPVAFGEGNTGDRVRHVFRYQEPAKVVAVVLVVVVAVFVLRFLTDPPRETDPNHLGAAPYRVNKLLYAADDRAPSEDAMFYLTTAGTLRMEDGDGTVTELEGQWSGAGDADAQSCAQWERLLEQATGLSLDPVNYALTIGGRDAESFYLLTRHGEHIPVPARLTYLQRDPAGDYTVVWMLAVEPVLHFLGYPEETAFYGHSLEAMGLQQVEVFALEHQNTMERWGLQEYVAQTYRFVGFTCDGGARIGWALYEISDGYDWVEFTGQMYIYHADTNNGIIISGAPATLNHTGEITDDTACNVVLVANPAVVRITGLYSDGLRNSWPLEGTPDMAVVPWSNEGADLEYIYFEDLYGGLIPDGDGTWGDTPEDQQLLLENFAALEKIALGYLDDPDNAGVHNAHLYGVSAVTRYDGAHPMVQFTTYAYNGRYAGYYYSPDDVPLAFCNKSTELTKTDDGWTWDGGSTGRITKYWFSFVME